MKNQVRSLWKCENYKKMKCKGRLRVRNNEIIKEQIHNHVLDSGKIEVNIAMNILKERAIEQPDLRQRAVIDLISTTVSSLIQNII
jgi:hypothetical protein